MTNSNQYKSACVNEEEAFDKLAVIKTQKQQVDEDKISSIERVYVRRYLQKMKHREETAVILCSMYRDELIKVREKVREQKLQLDIVKTTLEMEKDKLKVQCQQKCNQIREFWRSKLVEGSCRSGNLVSMAIHEHARSV